MSIYDFMTRLTSYLSANQPFFCTATLILIDHFHYDVTRAKASGSCSKDCAQCRAIAGKCQKISRLAPCRPRQATRCFTKLCARLLSNSKKFSLEFFFSINEELRSVVNEHFNRKLFSQILDTECVAGKRVLVPIQFPS